MTTQPHPRIPNLALRRARQEMRLTQAQFADAVKAAGRAIGEPNKCTKRLLQKWETGEHAGCRPDYLRALKSLTSLSARELGFDVLPDESGRSIPALGNRAESAISALSGGEGTAAAVAFTFATSGMKARDADEVLEESMDRLRHALENPSTVDMRTAQFVETSTARLFHLEHHSPARLLAPTVDRHLATATALLTAAQHEKVRLSLANSAGRIALLAGRLAFDRGDPASANRFWDSAIGAAEGTRDGGLFAATLTFQSYAAQRRGDPGAAWQLAHDALAHCPDDARATSWTYARIALYAAQLGEKHAAETAMERSLETGSEVGSPRPGDNTAPWMRFFDRARLMASTAHTEALLKDYPNARDHAVSAVDLLSPVKVKSRAIVLAEATLALAMSDELDRCLQYGREAAELTHELDVSIAADLLHQVIAELVAYSDTRSVQELLPHLTRLNRASDREDERDAAHQARTEAASEDPE